MSVPVSLEGRSAGELAKMLVENEEEQSREWKRKERFPTISPKYLAELEAEAARIREALTHFIPLGSAERILVNRYLSPKVVVAENHKYGGIDIAILAVTPAEEFQSSMLRR